MNLHAIASRAISCLHPNVSLILVRAQGSENAIEKINHSFAVEEARKVRKRQDTGLGLGFNFGDSADANRVFYDGVAFVQNCIELIELENDHIFADGIVDARRMLADSADAIAEDDPEWITVHPNGKGYNSNGDKIKGQPMLVESSTGEVLGGMGGKFNGKHISEATKNPIQASHVVKRGQEQRKDPEGFAKRMQEAKERKEQQEKQAAQPQTNSAGQELNLGYEGSVRDGFEAPTKGQFKDMLKAEPKVTKDQAAHLRKAFTALSDKAWTPPDNSPKFDDPKEQAAFDRAQREVFAYDVMKYIGGHSSSLPAQTVAKGEKAKRVYADALRKHAASKQSEINGLVSSSLKDSIALANELGADLNNLIDQAQGEYNYKCDHRCKVTEAFCKSNIGRYAMFPASKDAFAALRQNSTDVSAIPLNKFHNDEAFRSLVAAGIASELAARIMDANNKPELKERAEHNFNQAVENFAAVREHMMHSAGGADIDTALNRCYDRDSVAKFQSEHGLSGATAYLPSSVSGASRGQEMDFEQADQGRANPHYGKGYLMRKVDEKSSREVSSYNVNCQSCVVANELRRRGYDVEAQPSNKLLPGNMCVDLSYNPRMVWRSHETGTVPDHITVSDARQLNNIIQEGQRYCLEWMWSFSRSGHIINALRENGECFVFDPQNGKKMSLDDFSKNNPPGRAFDMKAFRIDNCDLVTDLAEHVLTKANLGPITKIPTKDKVSST